MAPSPGTFLRKFSQSVAQRVLNDLQPSLQAERSQLGAIDRQLSELAEKVRQLQALAEAGSRASTEVSALFGELLRTANERIEALEEKVTAGR